MNIGVVAIGRNEGERLRLCLVSALRDGRPVVYVDSGSTDGSVELARGLGATVVSLDLTKPFTAARARNAGTERLVQLNPSIDAIQFVDGDCEFAPGWFQAAERFLGEHPQAAIACGRRRERYPDATMYNRLCDMEWDTPVGRAKACGGDALIRRTAFEQVGGYNGEIIAGEEPEMCVRLRAAGWEIWRIDAEMTRHDAAMTRFGQWWKRHVRAGHAYAEGYDRHGAPPELFGKKEVRSNFIWALPPMWIFWPLLWAKVFARRPSGLYASSIVLSKLPQAIGQLKYFRNRASGRRSEIIEYKTAANA